MGDSSKEFMEPSILSEEYSQPLQIKLGNNSPLGNSESSEKVNSLSKLNTIIIRCSEDIIPTAHVRMCTTCLKIIDPEYYFSWEFMEFCNILCISKFQGLNFKCMYCSRFINNTLFGKFYIRTQKTFKYFCSMPCMNHYRLTIKYCLYCQRDISAGMNTVSYCSDTCYEAFNAIVKPPKILQNAICCVCKEEKFIDIVLKHDGIKYFCGKRCSVAYSFVKLRADIAQCIMCQYYFSQTLLQKYTVHYENITLVFCSPNCQDIYMLLNGKVVSCTWCHNTRYNFGMIRKFSNVPSHMYICSANCFKFYECSVYSGIAPATTLSTSEIQNFNIDNSLLANLEQSKDKDVNNLQYSPFVKSKQIMVQAKTPVDQRNVATMCFIPKADKNVIIKPDVSEKETQTDRPRKVILPIPVPIYVPTPMAMYSIPVPTPLPFPLPIPVPVFIPISKQSVISIMNEIKIVHDNTPADPCEAELLKIADIIAEEKANEILPDAPQESEASVSSRECSPIDNLLNTSWDLSACTSKQLEHDTGICNVVEKVGAKRIYDNSDSCESSNKRITCDVKSIKKISLNYALGMSALQQWMKNSDVSKKSKRGKASIKTDILQMLPEVLDLLLTQFLKNLKKPDGAEYAPDTLYYLCLGIQHYLSENGRTDNIFLDKSYDKFCDTLNKYAESFNAIHQEGSHLIVTRVNEEHLWDTKQLGCHTPLILLHTLVYFNTKYYHCSILEQHKEMSFSQVLKLWNKKLKSKSMMLRFHPRKAGAKRVFEQYANYIDETRCPVRIYEFYLSKCPESAKSSNNLFYLQPEQHCTPDSPLWYMNSSLADDTLMKMLNRVKIVKEINIELLSK